MTKRELIEALKDVPDDAEMATTMYDQEFCSWQIGDITHIRRAEWRGKVWYEIGDNHNE